VREILLGHGTSSGGNVALRVFPTRYTLARLDFNRTIHNEWLRAFYEWGVVGLSLWIGVFASILGGLVMRYRDASSRRRASAALSFLPAFLAALATENIVAGAGNGVTMSFAIVMAILWEPVTSRQPMGAPNV
jgi:O-antigen ligase